MARDLGPEERLVAAGRHEEALVRLWAALAETRSAGDTTALARIVGLAAEIREGGTVDRSRAEALSSTARAALFDARRREETSRPWRPAAYAPRTRRTRRYSSALAAARILPLAALAAVALVTAALLLREEYEERQPFGPEVRVVAPGTNDDAGRTIRRAGLFLVPFDDTSRPLLARIARRIERKYDVRAAVLSRLRTEARAFDAERRQVEGDGIIDLIEAAYPTRNPRAAVVGVTNADLFWTGASDDRFAFGVVADSRYAVVSTARMDPENYGGEPDEGLLERRLETMVTRYLGTLHFHLARTNNPKSAMRSSIRTLGDLDEASPDLCPERPREPVTC